MARDEAALAATFRTIVDVLSPSLAVLDMDVVNYSTPAIATRRSLQRYWSMFDGSTYNVSVYTRTTHDGEEATCEFLSVRDKARYPDSYCRQLANFDNALLGYAANSMGQLAYHMVNFPPPFLTADVIFVPAPETYGRDLVTIMIPQPSIQLVRPIETAASFSHPALQLSRAIIRKGKTRRIGGGTLFIFFKIKEVRYPDPDAKRPQEPPRETIFSATGQSFEVDPNFSQKINAVYGNIVPDELLTLASVLSNVVNDPAETPLSFEAYLESRRGDMQTRRLTTELILGGSAFSPQQIDKLCKILGTTINRASQGGVGLMDLAELLGFVH